MSSHFQSFLFLSSVCSDVKNASFHPSSKIIFDLEEEKFHCRTGQLIYHLVPKKDEFVVQLLCICLTVDNYFLSVCLCALFSLNYSVHCCWVTLLLKETCSCEINMTLMGNTWKLHLNICCL